MAEELWWHRMWRQPSIAAMATGDYVATRRKYETGSEYEKEEGKCLFTISISLFLEMSSNSID